MKRLVNLFFVSALLCGFIGLFSCNSANAPSDDNNTDLEAPEDFEYDTHQTVNVRFEAHTQAGEPIGMIRCQIWSDLESSRDPEGNPLAVGFTTEEGILQASVRLALTQDSIYLSMDYIGQLSNSVAAVGNGNIVFILGEGVRGQNKAGSGKLTSERNLGKAIENSSSPTFSYLGSWNSSGVPDYLESTPGTVSEALLSSINSTLANRSSVPTYNPDLLSSGLQTNLQIEQDTDLYLTFIDEGTWYYDPLVFYTYDTNNPPNSASDITDMTVVFPYVWTGVNLDAGDRVHLGNFEAGTTVAFALIRRGYSGGNVSTGSDIRYSDVNLNSESSGNEQHSVLLQYEEPTSKVSDPLFVFGFEEPSRDFWWADDDFNDLIFYVESDVSGAISTTDVASFPDPTIADCDGDGIPDYWDVYPCDGNRALQVAVDWETVAFDDDWPALGDLDYNDLIIDARYVMTCDYNYDFTDFVATYVIRAMGTDKENGFGIILPIAPEKVESVFGQSITGSVHTINANGTEAGQSNAVIMIFDDGTTLMNPPEPGATVNTEKGYQFVEYDTLSIQVVLTEPIPPADMGWPPYNPFIVVDQNRDIEVHLNNETPTDLVDTSLFGTGDDASNAGSGVYYRTSSNLTWALNITESWGYPFEGISTSDAYYNFNGWVSSGGASYTNWYEANSSTRDDNKIYSAFGISKK